MTRALGVLLACLLVALTACERAKPAGSSTATGAGGAPGPRIVALSPAIAVIIRDLGQGSKLVGRHGFDTFSDPALPVCGDQAGLDYEALLRVRPTHVLTQWGRRDRPERLATLAREHGWTLRDFPMLSLAEVEEAAATLAADLAVPAPPAIRLQEQGRRPDRAAIGRVLMLYGGEPPAALGPGSFHHELLVDLGATPAVREGAAFITLDAEDVLRLAPDAIIIIAPRDPNAETNVPPPPGAENADAAVAALRGLAKLDLPALRTRRVAIIDDPLSATPGTNLRTLRATLAEIVDGWR